MTATQERPKSSPIQLYISLEQREVMQRETDRRRWSFQTLVDEALKRYFEAQGLEWPERKTR